MKLGDIEFHIFSAGNLRLDGGAMFGVIPKPIWAKKTEPDARNRIPMAMNSLLIFADGKRILVETGAGDKMNAKFRDVYALGAPALLDVLRRYDTKPEDIDIVVNTHLHFDHCGGNTRLERETVVPTFPNAKYVVHKDEYDHALHPTERDRASYFDENYVPLEKAGALSLVEGDSYTVTPGVELIRVPGHTANMFCVKLTGGGETAFSFADLIPTTAHLPLPWIMGYDLYPMTTLENKKRWIPKIVEEGWLALFAHDPNVTAAYFRQRDSDHGVQWEAEPVTVA